MRSKTRRGTQIVRHLARLAGLAGATILLANPSKADTPDPVVQNPPGGVATTITYASDTLWVIGGRQSAAMYNGRVGLILDADLEKTLGWSGTTGHLSVHAIHGTGVLGDTLGNLLVVSGLEAEPTVRLFNIWIERRLGAGSLRVGQFTAAQEFVGSANANLFVNSTFGWPASFAVDLPSGGPAYPLSAPGVRMALAPTKATTVLAAIFAGDPAGQGAGDPQSRDKSGLNGFRLSGSALAIAEVQKAFGEAGRGATLKAGAWWHFSRFEDLRPQNAAAAGAAGGAAKAHQGDAAAYVVLDGPLWASRASPGRTLSGFLRATAAPADRNRIDRYFDVGLTLSAPLAGRPDDALGLAFGRAHVSSDAQRATEYSIGALGSRLRVPDYEAVLDLTYRASISSHLSLQPDLQYVMHPTSIDDATGLLHRSRDAVVVGLHTSLRY